MCVLAIVLWTLFNRLNLFPPWFKPLRLAAVIFLFIGVFLYAALLLFQRGLSEQTHSTGNETAEFVAIERGSFGSTWTDIVERRRIALVFVKERPLVQYNQEKVLGLDATAPKVLRVRLVAAGGGERVEELRLD